MNNMNNINTENQIWELRRKMVGMKNITEEKMQKNTKTFEKIIAEIYCKDSGATKLDINAVELNMDFIRYIWKCTLRGFMTLETFVEEKENAFQHITCECNECIPEWLQVQVSEFIEDMNFLVENEVMPEVPIPTEIKKTNDKLEIIDKPFEDLKKEEDLREKEKDERQQQIGNRNLFVPTQVTFGVPFGVMSEVILTDTKKEFADVIMERLRRVKYLSGRVKVVYVLETIKISCDMLEKFEGMESFKEKVVKKIDELTSSRRLNNDQMYEMRIQRNRIENRIEQFDKVFENNQIWYKMVMNKKIQRESM